MRHEIFAHNIGFDRPRLTHADFVGYLFECARMWNGQPNGQEQALNVQALAIQQETLTPKTCPVCLAIARRERN